MNTITTNNVIQFPVEWGGRQRECKVELQEKNDCKVSFDGVFLTLLNINKETSQVNKKWGVPLDMETVNIIGNKVSANLA